MSIRQRVDDDGTGVVNYRPPPSVYIAPRSSNGVALVNGQELTTVPTDDVQEGYALAIGPTGAPVWSDVSGGGVLPSYALNGVLYSTADAWALTPAGTSGQVLTSGVGGTPAFATHTAELPTAATGNVLVGNGTSWVAAAPGTTGQVLVATTSAAPAFAAIPYAVQTGQIPTSQGTGPYQSLSVSVPGLTATGVVLITPVSIVTTNLKAWVQLAADAFVIVADQNAVTFAYAVLAL